MQNSTVNVLRTALEQRVAEVGPACVVTLNDSGHPIYSSLIQRDRPPGVAGEEELVRALLIIHLVHDRDYPPENICIEHRVRARVGRDASDKYMDIAIRQGKHKEAAVYALIECKSVTAYGREHDKAWEQQLFALTKFLDEPPEFLAYSTVKAGDLGWSSTTPPPPRLT